MTPPPAPIPPSSHDPDPTPAPVPAHEPRPFPKPLRYLCTGVLLTCVAMAGWLMHPWVRFIPVFESMVEGGVEALPFPQPLMLGHPGWKVGWLLLPTIPLLLQIWRPRSGFLTTLATTALTGLLLMAASIGGTLLLNQSLKIVIEKIEE